MPESAVRSRQTANMSKTSLMRGPVRLSWAVLPNHSILSASGRQREMRCIVERGVDLVLTKPVSAWDNILTELCAVGADQIALGVYYSPNFCFRRSHPHDLLGKVANPDHRSSAHIVSGASAVCNTDKTASPDIRSNG
jgi:hypothetical protein